MHFDALNRRDFVKRAALAAAATTMPATTWSEVSARASALHRSAYVFDAHVHALEAGKIAGAVCGLIPRVLLRNGDGAGNQAYCGLRFQEGLRQRSQRAGPAELDGGCPPAASRQADRWPDNSQSL